MRLLIHAIAKANVLAQRHGYHLISIINTAAQAAGIS